MPYKLLEQCLCCGLIRVMIRPVWPVVVECIQAFHNWPHLTDHNPYTPTTQTLLELLIKHLRRPWRWQPLAETCWGRIWNTLIKSTSYLTHLLVIAHRYYKILGPTIKICNKVLSSPKRPDQLWGLCSILFSGYRSFSPGRKWSATRRWPPTSIFCRG
jgi:hypothetical protein